jgi:hypothetical protein
VQQWHQHAGMQGLTEGVKDSHAGILLVLLLVLVGPMTNYVGYIIEYIFSKLLFFLGT